MELGSFMKEMRRNDDQRLIAENGLSALGRDVGYTNRYNNFN